MSRVEPLLHVAERDVFEASRTGTHYAPAAFAEEGFVHCCTDAQLAGVLQRYYRDRDDLVRLLLDADALDAPLRFEDTTGRGEAFPHIYGPIPHAAVRAQRSIRTDAGGALSDGDALRRGPRGSNPEAALEHAAFVLASEFRDGVHAQLGSLTDPATSRWLTEELARRCPGFTDEDYGRALGDGFLASR